MSAALVTNHSISVLLYMHTYYHMAHPHITQSVFHSGYQRIEHLHTH